MPANQFYPLATGTGANALTNAQWAALGTLLAQGFQSGVVPSIQFNTFLRQFSVPVSAIAQMMADNQSADVLDDGVVANFEAKLKAAIQNISAYVAQAGQEVFFSAGGSSTVYTGTLAPAPTSLTPDMEVLGSFGTANTTTSPTLNLNGFGAKPILKQGGGVPSAGDIFGFVPLILNSAGTAWVINGMVASDVLALIAANQIGPAGVQVFSTAGTFTYSPTLGTRTIKVRVQGGGGGGGGSVVTTSSTYAVGISGSAGAYAEKFIFSGFSGATIVVGAAGAAGAVGGSGGNGGSSSFTWGGNAITCGPGLGGGAGFQINNTSPYTSAENQGGSASGGDLNVAGSACQSSTGYTAGTVLAGRAGESFIGKSSINYATTRAGAAGTGPGAGGTAGTSYSSDSSGQAGGPGNVGIVIVEEYH